MASLEADLKGLYSNVPVTLRPTKRFVVFDFQLLQHHQAATVKKKKAKSIRQQQRPEPPPGAEAARLHMEQALGGLAVTCDELTTGTHVLQLRKGHRFSNDDLFTAWRACHAAPLAASLLDIGSGIGSVGLATLAKMRKGKAATLVGIEAQEISFKLASASVAMQPHLRDNGRVRFLHGDLRDSDAVLANLAGAGMEPHLPQHYDLVTGSPPYLPADCAIQSPVPQRAPCRVELRGSVYDYCAAAARHLRPGPCSGSRFVFVMLTQDPRTFDAPVKAGLRVLEQYDYTFMSGRKPHISTLVCCLAQDGTAPAPETPVRRGHMLLRDRATGEFTPEHRAFKEFMLSTDLPPAIPGGGGDGGGGASRI